MHLQPFAVFFFETVGQFAQRSTFAESRMLWCVYAPDVESSRTHFEVLNLEGQVFGLGLEASPQVLENCPVLGSRTALFFEPLKFCWKTPETLRKICEDLFFVLLNCISREKFVEDLFFWRTLAPVSLASSTPVLGLERVFPRKGCSWAWPRIFCVLDFGFEPCVLDSTSGTHYSSYYNNDLHNYFFAFRLGSKENVDTTSLRRAIWKYVHCMYGIM